MHKKSLFALSALLLLISCTNIFDSDTTDEHDRQEVYEEIIDTPSTPGAETPSATPDIPQVVLPPPPKYANVTGTISIAGAVPSEMFVDENSEDNNPNPNGSNQNNSAERTARPSMPAPSDEYKYFVKATYTYTDADGNSAVETQEAFCDENFNYNIRLELDKEWILTAGYKKLANGDNPDVPGYDPEKVLMIDTGSVSPEDTILPLTVTLTEEDVILPDCNFILQPTTDGTGNVHLRLDSLPTGTDGVKTLVILKSGGAGELPTVATGFTNNVWNTSESEKYITAVTAFAI